jgi:hypothetical protein
MFGFKRRHGVKMVAGVEIKYVELADQVVSSQ